MTFTLLKLLFYELFVAKLLKKLMKIIVFREIWEFFMIYLSFSIIFNLIWHHYFLFFKRDSYCVKSTPISFKSSF